MDLVPIAEQQVRDQLIAAYRKVADMTRPLCAGEGKGACRVPHSCCDDFNCQLTANTARERWRVDLMETTKDCDIVDGDLPFMGPDGCVVDPHLRPVCSVHVCCIQGLGCRPGHPKWTQEYFDLRDEIGELEDQLTCLMDNLPES